VNGSRNGDGGQVVPLVAVALLVLGAAAYGIVTVGGVLVERAVARTAADAAALELAATDDEQAAREVADANGAEVVAIRRVGASVEVEVRVGRVTARARASSSVAWVPPEERGGARPRGAIP
jgi:Flp pilus assembly protein TadG